MKKINVIDLDNTLIPFDSFREVILNEIKNFNLPVIYYSLLRKLRLIDQSKYKIKILDAADLSDRQRIIKIKNEILNSINEEVLQKVDTHSGKSSIEILCSASPHIYVKEVARELGWHGYGTFFYDRPFYHMYGENKAKFIQTKYPSDKYIYNYSISDNNNDLSLLKLFKNYELIQ